MKSNKQRRAEIVSRRSRRIERRALRGANAVPVNPEHLAPSNSYDTPQFVKRGYYVDKAFRCKDCGKEQTWRATQQKWWYEVAKGDVFTMAVRCRACRAKERERVAEARRVSLEGLAAKRKAKPNLSLNPDASPAALTRRPLGAG